MANKNITNFVNQYGPIALQVSKEIGVDPNVILSHWGKETRWGQSIVPGTNNLGNVKNFTGHGVEATDNMTKTKDRYEQFEDPEVFGMYYADMIKRLYPEAVNTGIDVDAFTKGLTKGTKGSYFQDNPKSYAESLTNFVTSIPEDKQLPMPESAVGADVGREDLVPTKAAPIERKPDMSSASPGERLLFGGAGAGVGTLASGAKGFLERGPARAYAQEIARLKAQQAMGMGPPVTPATPPATPAASNLITTPDQAARIQQGTTGDLGTTGKQRMTMLDQTAQKAAQSRKVAETLLELQKAGLTVEQASSLLANAPGFTSTPSGVVFSTTEAPTTLGPRGPQGEVGFYREAPKATPALPKPSGLDKVNQVFESMMKYAGPLKPALSVAGKYIAPPVAAAVSGLDLAELLHEYDKPEIDRDKMKMLLKGGSALGGLTSLVAPEIGIPMSMGFTAADIARGNRSVMDTMPTQALPIPRIQPQLTQEEMMQQAMQKSLEQQNVQPQGMQQMQGLGLY